MHGWMDRCIEDGWFFYLFIVIVIAKLELSQTD